MHFHPRNVRFSRAPGAAGSLALGAAIAAAGLFAAPVPASAQDAAAPTASAPAPDELELARARLAPGDHAGAIALAKKAIKLGRLDDADDLYRSVLDDDQLNDEAFHGLWDLSRGRELSRESEAYVTTRALLPETFREYGTSHFVILSDADPSWVHRHGQRLERAHDRFIRYALGLELRALPLRHKLVAVAFSRRADFVKFGKRDGTPSGARIAGYYSRPADRLVFFHVESDENVESARRQLEDMWADADAIHRASRRARSTGRRDEGEDLRDRYDRQARHISEQERRINDFALKQSISVTIHEAVHQLMFHTGVQSPYVHHPMWLTEGLATAFETDNPKSSFGPSQEYWPRREAFYNLLDSGRVLPLRTFVTLDESVFRKDPGAVTVVYHQGYALVTWLSRYRRPGLRDYLRRLNALPPELQTPAEHLALFESCFGDVDRLEQAWLRHEDDD